MHKSLQLIVQFSQHGIKQPTAMSWYTLHTLPRLSSLIASNIGYNGCNTNAVAYSRSFNWSIHHLPVNQLLKTVLSISTVDVLTKRNYSKFTAGRETLPLGAHPLCEERALDLVSNLKEAELAAIKLALRKYDAMKQKEFFEGKLAATRWRTRFGRYANVSKLGEVDPTGSFCAFPDDWLKRKAAEKAPNPTKADLWKIFLVNAVPFVGFGFLDNFTMILAGDYIEHIFGTFMCISTMAAAGLGNTISDVLGIGSAYYVERGCELMGLKTPDLTPIQMEMKSSRRAANFGRICGIIIGCLVGMFPLLLMDRKEDEERKKEEAKHLNE